MVFIFPAALWPLGKKTGSSRLVQLFHLSVAPTLDCPHDVLVSQIWPAANARRQSGRVAGRCAGADSHRTDLLQIDRAAGHQAGQTVENIARVNTSPRFLSVTPL